MFYSRSLASVTGSVNYNDRLPVSATRIGHGLSRPAGSAIPYRNNEVGVIDHITVALVHTVGRIVALEYGKDTKKEPLPTPKPGIDRGSWFVFRAFKQVPKSTFISALKKKLRREYNHFGWSICAALRLAITGFFDP